ncbi:MAG: diguanylate cyclase [Dehalococcoidia bacterium]|nr:diguanylate cyclase [Dehalococcoidia bacterium]
MDRQSPERLSSSRARFWRVLPLPLLLAAGGVAVQRVFPEDPSAGGTLLVLCGLIGVALLVADRRTGRPVPPVAVAPARPPVIVVDEESGLGNRVQLEEILIHEMSRSHRHGRPSTLAVFEISLAGFHPTAPGDLPPSPVRHVAQLLIDGVRESDYVLRLDGTRFAVLFTESEAKAVDGVIERLRTGLALKAYARNADSSGVFVRGWAGRAEWQPSYGDPSQYLAAALAHLEQTRVGYEAAQSYFRGRQPA